MTSPIHTSLIVVNYNGAALLPGCVESILAHLPPGCELLVVDNASADDSLAVLVKYPAVRVVPLPSNVGFGRACNLGAAAAQGDLLLFLNPDVRFVDGWLEPLWEVSADPSVGLFCPRMLHPGDPLPSSTAVVEHAALPGCGLAARRAAWLAIGGFDEAIFLYWEDTELCWRAWLLGWRVVEVWGGCILHERGGIARSFGRWDAERAKNSLYTYVKLIPWPSVLIFALRLLGVCVAKAALRPALIPGLARAWVWNLRHLPQTLRARRAVAARRVGDYGELERRIRVQRAHLRAEARARRAVDKVTR